MESFKCVFDPVLTQRYTTWNSQFRLWKTCYSFGPIGMISVNKNKCAKIDWIEVVGITGRKCIWCQLAFGIVGIRNKSLCWHCTSVYSKKTYLFHALYFYTQAHSRTHKLKAKQSQIHFILIGSNLTNQKTTKTIHSRLFHNNNNIQKVQ